MVYHSAFLSTIHRAKSSIFRSSSNYFGTPSPFAPSRLYIPRKYTNVRAYHTKNTTPLTNTALWRVPRRKMASRRGASEDAGSEEGGESASRPSPFRDGFKEPEGVPGLDPMKRDDRSLPPELRTRESYFRPGLTVPHIKADNWITRFFLEPFVFAKGHYYVWMDSNLRLSRAGFYLLHIFGAIIAITGGYFISELAWGDIEEQLDISQELYLLDVARLLWVRRALRNCEIVMNERQNGIIPGLLPSEIIQEEQDLPFRQHLPRASEYIERSNAIKGLYNNNNEQLTTTEQLHLLAQAERQNVLRQSEQNIYKPQIEASQQSMAKYAKQQRQDFKQKYIFSQIKPPSV